MSSEARQRKQPSQQTKSVLAQLDKHGRYKRTAPARPPKKPARSLHLGISFLLLACLLIYAQRSGVGKKGAYTVDGGARPLPSWYAVCSKEGKKIYTVPVAGGEGAVECVVVGDKEVVDTGSLAHVRRHWGDRSAGGAAADAPEHIKKQKGLKVVYLPPGHTLTPGLIDGHGHALDYGASRGLRLETAKTLSETVGLVEAYVAAHKPRAGDWVFGGGWDQTQWPVKDFPTAADLDTPALRGVPIVLYRTDLHAVWVSPSLLATIGPFPDEDIVGGQVVRDGAGQPTGVFLDNAIREYVTPHMPPVTDVHREEHLTTMMNDALAVGLTGVHDAAVAVDEIAFFRKMADDNKLKIRFYSMLLCAERSEFCGDQFKHIIGAADGRWTLRSVKLFADGALGSRGAALIEDYSDQPGWKGFLLADDDVWKPLIKEYYDAGWQVNVHCIGDKANNVVLDAMEAAIGSDRVAGRERRLRIEHAQIFTQDDIKRAAELGVIGSFQPTHATSDMWYCEDRLGPERSRGAYAWRTYLEHGGRLVLGSDFPVESIDPLRGFYAAVTRCAEDGTSPHGPDGWFADQKLGRVEALRGFTTDPAYASFSNNTGSLTPGYRFDAVLWDDDLLTVDEREMLDVRVKATIVDGRIAYGEWKV